MTPITHTILALLLPFAVHAQARPPADHDAFFGLDKIWDVHIRVPKDGWNAMQPDGVGYTARFPYTEATVRIAGHGAMTVGLRFKGNSTYWKLPRGFAKKSFKFDFDRFQKKQAFLGLKKLNLHNNYFDETQLREALSLSAYRESGVPAARTAFARVYLTIQGRGANGPGAKVDEQYLGLYTLVEQVDREFLKRRTGHAGTLLKPEGRILPYLGDVWNEGYAKAYRAKTEVGKKAGRAIVELARVMRDHGSGFDAADGRRDFRTRLQKVLDVDEFLRYLAVSVLIGNGDNWLFLGPKNYYLAVSDETGRISVLAWDLNNSIGGMGKYTGLNFEELSIHRPSRVLLVTRILEVPEWRQRYTRIVRELIAGPCSEKRMIAALRVARKTVAGAIAEEARRSGKRSRPADLSRFFAAREKSVLDQLAGRSRGVEIGWGKKGGRGERRTRGAKQENAVDWNARYEKLLEDNASVRAKVESGATSKEEVIAWMKAKAMPAKKGAGERGPGKKSADKQTRRPGKRVRKGARPLVDGRWDQFRGPNGDGSSDAKSLPVEIGETKNLRWSTPIHDQGWSSPVVLGQQIWLTTGRRDGRELFAVCVDLSTGEIVHDIKVFDVANPQSENPQLNTHASPTPVIEAGRIYVHFGAYGTACLDTKTGEKLWERRDLKCDHRVRAASSSILDGDLLFVTFDGVDNRFVAALEKKTGSTRWLREREGQTDPVEFFRKQGHEDAEKIMRKKPNDNYKSYATPTVIEHEGRRQLISPAAEFTFAYDARTGEDLWRVRHRGMGFNVACRPVYANGLVYITTGIARRLLAVRPTGSGDVTATHVAWTGRRAIPNYSSPVPVGGLLFHVGDQGGVVSCLDAISGETVFRKRLGDGGRHWASPVHADGKIYFCSEEGDITVIAAKREFQELADNRIDGTFMASPAIAGNALILRSTSHLYCFAVE